MRTFGLFGWSAIALAATGASAAETVTYKYDALGRLIRVDHAGGPNNAEVVTYEYDPAGNRTRVTGPNRPEGFDLGADVTSAAAGQWYSSAVVTPTGFTGQVAVSITDGEYRIDGGAWQTAAGTIQLGQSVQVRALSSVSAGTTKTATLTIGGVSDAFRVTTGVDTTPAAFDLGAAVTGAAAGDWYSSATITPGGYNSAATISVTGGQYRVDGGAWQTAAGTLQPSQTVQVRVQSPTTQGASQTATLTVGGVSDGYQVTTGVDTTPHTFDLGAPVAGAASGTWHSSSIVTPTGYNSGASIAVSGGQYRINGGAWQAAAGTMQPGQTVQVQAQAPAAGGATQTATLTVGGVSDTYQVSTAADTTPDAFDLGAAVTNAAGGAWYPSSVLTPTGYNSGVPVTVSGGQYRINGGAWTSTAGTLQPGQTVQVQVQAPATGGASQTATLTVGGVSDTYQVTTAVDATPDAFDLGAAASGASGTWYASSTVTPAGFNTGAAISITNGQYRINGGAWTSTAGTLQPGQTVQVQVQAPAAGGASQTATLTIGGISDTYQVTAVVDTTPDAFDLGAAVTGATSGTWHASSMITPTGFNSGASIAVSGGQYRINGGAWQTAAGTLQPGQTVQVQAQAPATVGASQTATLTIGGVSDTFQVATADLEPDARDWPDMTPSWSGVNGMSSYPDWVDGPTLTIAGLTSGASAELTFSVDSVSGGEAGLVVEVYKNGAYQGRAMSVSDGWGTSGGSTIPQITVTNGDTVRFRARVFATGIAAGSTGSADRSARLVVRNGATGGALFDTITVTGWYSEDANGCDPTGTEMCDVE